MAQPGTMTAKDCISLNCNEKSEKAIARAMEKCARKLAKKSSKMMNVIAKQVDVTLTSAPSMWAVVWGLGIAGGNSKQFVKTYLKPHPVEVRLVPDKTYCFIRLVNLGDAAVIKDLYDGKSLDESQTIYIGYIDGDPPEESSEPLLSFNVPWPEGLSIIPEFINHNEEKALIEELIPCSLEKSGTSLKKRWVTHFGYEFRYGTNDVDYDSPMKEGMPDYLTPFINSIMSKNSIYQKPEQLTVNHYLPGQGIPPHVDTHSCFEGPIVALSLGSDIVMDFRRGDQSVSAVIPARAVVVMNEEARYGWTHSIRSRKVDIVPDKVNGGLTVLHRGIRISLTFRNLRKSRVCNCSFPEMCDSQNGKITEENAADLEAKMVHEVYEKIAPHFDETRHKPWPKVKEFVTNIEAGETLLDVGCGNGKYFNINNNIFQVGTDMSAGLLDICRDKCGEFLRANALRLPFKDESFKAVICIAVLHHLATKDRRLAAIREMLRTMRIGGQALIYVWAKDQRYEEIESTWASKQGTKDTAKNKFVNNSTQPLKNYSFLPIHDQEVDFPRNDMLVPWVNVKDKESSVHHRYYHVFSKGELDELVKEIDPIPLIIDSYYDQGNWVIKIQKIS